MNDPKEHNCHRCISSRATIVELSGNIRGLCRQLEKGVGPTKKATLLEQIAGFKDRLKEQKRWNQEHLDEVLYAPVPA